MMLGIGGIGAAISSGAPLRVFRSVEDFIRHGGECGQSHPSANSGHGTVSSPFTPAVVVIDLPSAARELIAVLELVADDPDFALEPDAAIRAAMPRPPAIMVPRKAMAA